MLRCTLFILGLVMLGQGIVSLSSAQEVGGRPHMELVRGLRKEGMSDLALQYLDRLKAGKIDAETSLVLDLEYARTWLDIAGDENDELKRNTMIGQAKRKLEAFIAANGKHILAPQANVELARLNAVEGKQLIRKARKFEEPKQIAAAMKLAQPPLKAAADKYRATAGMIEAQLKTLDASKSPANDRLRKELLDFQTTAQLDEGITIYYLAETVVGDDTKDVAAQGKLYKDAQKIFEKLMYSDEKAPIAYIARAWCSQAQLKGGDPGTAEKTMNELLNKKGVPVAAAGLRVGRYFSILNSFDNYAKLEKDTLAWLQDYAAYRDTAEGLGCRYYLAKARGALGFPGLKIDKNMKVIGISPAGRAKLEEAQRGYKELADGENEYSERSARNRAQILVTLADADGNGDAPPVASLQNFERAYLMAQVQVARYAQFKNAIGMTPPSDEEIKKEELKRYGNALRYLEHALKIANQTKETEKDVFAAHLFLVACYSELKMYPQAAILSEHLSREYPKMQKASVAGSVSVQSYNRSQIELKGLKEKAIAESGDGDAKVEQFWDAKFKADTERMRRAAGYLIKEWPGETASDEARHLLAFYAAREKKFDEAYKAYAGIRNAYPAVQAARLELASVVFTMIYPTDNRDPSTFNQRLADNLRTYSKQWKEALGLLEATPAPEDEASLTDALCYINSRLQLARMYQLEGTAAKAEKVSTDLSKEIGRFTKPTAEQKADLSMNAKTVSLSAIRAQAVVDYKNGDHAKVAELLNPRIEEIKKDFAKKTPEESILIQRLRKTQRDTVTLALQSCVQDQKIDRAGELLDLLEASGGSVEEQMGTLQTLVNNVRSQLDELDAVIKKATTDKNKAEVDAKTAEAKILKDGFTKLLQKLIARGSVLPMKMKLFLAQGLVGVEAYAQATAELVEFRKIPKLAMPVEPAGNPNDEQTAKYKRELEDFAGYDKYQRQAQYMLARTYWKSKDYQKALALFAEMTGPLSSKGPTPKDKQGWAYPSLQVRKDKAMMLEEMALAAPEADRMRRWSEAVQEWIGIAKTFSPQLVPIQQNLKPEDEARKFLFMALVAPRADDDETDFTVMRIPLICMNYGALLTEERENAARLAQETAVKRERYFDLYFEQKRCSVMAFSKIGPAAVKGSTADFQQKFVDFAKQFKDLQSKEKNPDLPAELKTRIKHLVDTVPELKREYDKPSG